MDAAPSSNSHGPSSDDKKQNIQAKPHSGEAVPDNYAFQMKLLQIAMPLMTQVQTMQMKGPHAPVDPATLQEITHMLKRHKPQYRELRRAVKHAQKSKPAAAGDIASKSTQAAGAGKAASSPGQKAAALPQSGSDHHVAQHSPAAEQSLLGKQATDSIPGTAEPSAPAHQTRAKTAPAVASATAAPPPTHCAEAVTSAVPDGLSGQAIQEANRPSGPADDAHGSVLEADPDALALRESADLCTLSALLHGFPILVNSHSHDCLQDDFIALTFHAWL